MTRFLLTLGIGGMEAFWLFVWAALIGRFSDQTNGRPLLSAISILALTLLAAFSTQYLGRRALNSVTSRGALIVLGVAALLVVIRIDEYPGTAGLEWLGLIVTALAVAIGGLSAPALAFAMGIFVWWRGITIGRQSSTNVEVETSFRWGVGMLVAFALAEVITFHDTPKLQQLQEETTLPLIGFFFASMLTLALGRLESLSTRTRRIGINSQWFSVLLLIAASVVLVALLLGQILSFDLLVTASQPVFDFVGRLLLILLYVIVIPVAYVLELIIYAIFRLLQPTVPRQPPQPPEPSDIDNMLNRMFGQGVPPDLIAWLKVAGVLALFGVALYVLNGAFRRWRPAAADAEAAREERSSVLGARRWRDLVLRWLAALLWWRKRPEAVAVVEPEDEAARAPGPEEVSVRALYRELLRRGALAGVHRTATTTPREHQPSLVRALEPEVAIALLTDAYQDERYGDQAPALDALRGELDAVHARPRDEPV